MSRKSSSLVNEPWVMRLKQVSREEVREGGTTGRRKHDVPDPTCKK